jgi:hypothetical protein
MIVAGAERNKYMPVEDVGVYLRDCGKHTHTHTQTHTQRERERERETDIYIYIYMYTYTIMGARSRSCVLSVDGRQRKFLGTESGSGFPGCKTKGLLPIHGSSSRLLSHSSPEISLPDASSVGSSWLFMVNCSSSCWHSTCLIGRHPILPYTPGQKQCITAAAKNADMCIYLEASILPQQPGILLG